MSQKNCPYCSREMVLGYIKTSGEVLTWSENSDMKPIFSTRSHVGKDEIKLGDYTFFKGDKVKAFKCSSCKKIIMDFE